MPAPLLSVQEESEVLTRIGPGTLMGNFMREYWIPAMLASELPHPDCDPVRVKLLGEELIAFRDTSNRIGLIQNACMHRCASLFFGRNEENGIRCVYHGWKYDVTGQCVDIPNDLAGPEYKAQIKATAYPCIEKNGFIWTYMGPRAVPPPLPRIPGNELPPGEELVSAISKEYNWLQGFEGNIDNSHFSFLHFGHKQPEDYPYGSRMWYVCRDRNPVVVTKDTDYGLIYGGKRVAEEIPGKVYWRVTQIFFPFATHSSGMQYLAHVPMDDEHSLLIRTDKADLAHFDPEHLPNTDDWYGRFRPVSNKENGYLLDREAKRTKKSYTGIGGGISLEDQALVESMGPIVDRRNEHLVGSDAAVLRFRQRILEAAFALADGVPAPGVDNPELWSYLAAGHLILPDTLSLSEVEEQLHEMQAPGEGADWQTMTIEQEFGARA
jgi:phenylpropionate dioxygenase-like ring-hydroxylating dioxygenase large terminal subunit